MSFQHFRRQSVVDAGCSETHALTKYDDFLRASILTHKLNLVQLLPLAPTDPHCSDEHLVNLRLGPAVEYALKGSDALLDSFSGFFGLMVTQASLFVTLNIQLFIFPPLLLNNTCSHVFLATIGASGLVEVLVIISVLIFYCVMFLPFRKLERYIIAYQLIPYVWAISALDLLGILLTIFACIFVGFTRRGVDTSDRLAFIDGYVQLWAPLVLLLLIVSCTGAVASAMYHGDDAVAYSFYLKYCEPSGELRGELVRRLGGEADAGEGEDSDGTFEGVSLRI